MCERLAGERGLPAPTPVGRPQRQRHRAAFRQDTNGIQMGYDQWSMRYDRIRTGYESPTGPVQANSTATAEAVSECRTWPRRWWSLCPNDGTDSALIPTDEAVSRCAPPPPLTFKSPTASLLPAHIYCPYLRSSRPTVLQCETKTKSKEFLNLDTHHH